MSDHSFETWTPDSPDYFKVKIVKYGITWHIDMTAGPMHVGEFGWGMAFTRRGAERKARRAIESMRRDHRRRKQAPTLQAVDLGVGEGPS